MQQGGYVSEMRARGECALEYAHPPSCCGMLPSRGTGGGSLRLAGVRVVGTDAYGEGHAWGFRASDETPLYWVDP